MRTSSRKTVRRAPAKPTALSLHLGLNSVNPQHYGGWSGDLLACEFDARDMAAVAKASGMTPKVLMTKQATRKNVLAALQAASKKLKAGDLFFLTFSGHGGQIDDVSGEEDDKLDETWCLFDAELIDDELYLELSRFAKGVRVLVLSDSCHSGTAVRAGAPRPNARGPRPRMMPPAIAIRTYRMHKAFYDKLQEDVARAAAASKPIVDPDEALANLHGSGPRLETIAATCKAAVILISGCQDNQTSMDGDRNGAFTEQLLRVWKKGAFQGDYRRFHATIRAGMDPRQTPNLFTLGRAATFLKQRPFVV
ncbi:MAG: caspase family protein [Vicinamibacterales bacterium]